MILDCHVAALLAMTWIADCHVAALLAMTWIADCRVAALLAMTWIADCRVADAPRNDGDSRLPRHCEPKAKQYEWSRHASLKALTHSF